MNLRIDAIQCQHKLHSTTTKTEHQDFSEGTTHCREVVLDCSFSFSYMLLLDITLILIKLQTEPTFPVMQL